MRGARYNFYSRRLVERQACALPVRALMVCKCSRLACAAKVREYLSPLNYRKDSIKVLKYEVQNLRPLANSAGESLYGAPHHCLVQSESWDGDAARGLRPRGLSAVDVTDSR